MRRIIERTVTVVTTTTWTIYWKDDPPPASLDHEADPTPSVENLPDNAEASQTTPLVMETKEVDDSSTRKVAYQMADQPPDRSHSHRLKKGNKKS
jgi:hypothetical protein